ncbi:MAG: diguanylate cyclase [Clostridia bacterium]|nr:diguanylate cyclase [Clostridia bacterium]
MKFLNLIKFDKKGFNEMHSDVSSNDYLIKGIRSTIVFFVFVWIANETNIFIVDKEILRPGIILAMLFLFIGIFIDLIFGRTKKWVKYVLIFLVVSAFTSVSTFLTYHTVLAALFPIFFAAQYSDKKVLRYTYFLCQISITVVVLLGYHVGLCDANMILLTVSKASEYNGTLSGPISPMSFEVAKNLVLFYVVPRIGIVTIYFFMMNSAIENRKIEYQRELEARYIGEHDRMTELFNRTKYIDMSERYYSNLDQVAIAFFDVNNLKKVNDLLGHDAGDALIKKAADSIKSCLKDQEAAFRLGGDEFAVVIPNGNDDSAKEFIKRWEITLDRLNSLPSYIDCQMASGFSSGNGSNISEILKEADKDMYKNKVAQKANRKD